jgi:hypothetical protein
MMVWGVPRAAVYELRDYGAASAEMFEVLSRRGMRAVMWEKGRLLFAFESLEARERAWRELSLDGEWRGLRVDLRGVSVFRVAGS